MAFHFVTWLRATVLLLAAQLLLGTWVNLFGSFPSTTSIVKALEYTKDPALTAHLLLAVLLVVVGFVIAVASFGPDTPPGLRSLAVTGLLAMLWSYEWGFQFILSGYASHTDWFWMVVGLIVGIVGYGFALAVVARPPPEAPAESARWTRAF